SGEQQFRVPPLALPDPALALPAGALSHFDGVALFVDRARQHAPGFALTEETAAVVAAICARLDGLPLAIELAAARLTISSPGALLRRLERRLPLLIGGARDLPARQQTLRDTIRWSADLLTDPERRLVRRLSVFVGGCTLDAADAVCAGRDDPR